jgi:hypothetical protein
MSLTAIERSRLGVLLIDVQPVFWEYAFGQDQQAREPVLVRLEHLLMLAGWLDLPLITSFEHPVAENGELPERLERVFPAHGERFTKRTYNCCLEPTIREAIKGLPVQQFAVAGCETDVCILQSVLGLLRMGYEVLLLEDCLFSSEPQPGPALQRMLQAGAIPCTLKSLAYELTESVDHTPWLATWIERDRDYARPFPEGFTPPEDWPAWQPNR